MSASPQKNRDQVSVCPIVNMDAQPHRNNGQTRGQNEPTDKAQINPFNKKILSIPAGNNTCMNTQHAIDLPTLAQAIGANPRSVRNAFYLRPQDFPPAIYLPGCRGPRFLVWDVQAWLESHKTTTPLPQVNTPQSKGRPRKASPAQIARARQHGQGGAA